MQTFLLEALQILPNIIGLSSRIKLFILILKLLRILEIT